MSRPLGLALAAGCLAVLLMPDPALAQHPVTGKCTIGSVAQRWPDSTTITFATGSSTISAADKAKLKQTADLAKANYIQELCITGYADKQGDDKKNNALSLARSRAVAAELRRNGIDNKQMKIQAKGEPGGSIFGSVNRATTADRRVEVRFTR